MMNILEFSKIRKLFEKIKIEYINEFRNKNKVHKIDPNLGIVLVPHCGLGDYIWAVNISVHLSVKYKKKIGILIIEKYYDVIYKLLIESGYIINVYLQKTLKVGDFIGDSSAIKKLNSNANGMVYYPMGWYAGRKIKKYPDDFFELFSLDVKKIEIRGLDKDINLLKKRKDLIAMPDDYIYINLNSATDVIDINKVLNIINNELPVLIVTNKTETRNIVLRGGNIAYIREKDITLKGHLALIQYAKNVILIDSAIFNLSKSFNLSCNEMSVWKRGHYKHKWGGVLLNETTIMGET